MFHAVELSVGGIAVVECLKEMRGVGKVWLKLRGQSQGMLFATGVFWSQMCIEMRCLQLWASC